MKTKTRLTRFTTAAFVALAAASMLFASCDKGNKGNNTNPYVRPDNPPQECTVSVLVDWDTTAPFVELDSARPDGSPATRAYWDYGSSAFRNEPGDKMHIWWLCTHPFTYSYEFHESLGRYAFIYDGLRTACDCPEPVFERSYAFVPGDMYSGDVELKFASESQPDENDMYVALTLPATQIIPKPTDFTRDARYCNQSYPMVTLAKGSEFMPFKRSCYFLIVRMRGKGQLEKMTFRATGGEALHGPARIPIRNGESSWLETLGGKGDYDTLSIDCHNAPMIFHEDEETALTICLPPIELSKGFSIDIYGYNEDGSYTKSFVYEKAFTPALNALGSFVIIEGVGVE